MSKLLEDLNGGFRLGNRYRVTMRQGDKTARRFSPAIPAYVDHTVEIGRDIENCSADDALDIMLRRLSVI